MTILEIINRTTDFFQAKGIEEARLNAEQLIAFGLKMKRMDLYMNFDRPLTPIELDELRPLVQKRAQRVPLQHILGSVAWRFLELKTDHRALIPRPDTEGIVDIAKKLLKDNPKPLILEVGVGSGAISLALGMEIPHAQITGIDISLDALSLAQENTQLNPTKIPIEWIHSDLFAQLEPQKFDLIISNPPYIPTADIHELEPEVKESDPWLALDGGIDGLDFYRRLLRESPDWLLDQGYLLCEIGYDQTESLRIEETKLQFVDFAQDLGQNDRFVWWQKK